MRIPFHTMRLNKALLALFSGLGFTGLAFYLWLFTIYNFNWKPGWLFVFSVATVVLGGVMVWCVFIAFSLIETELRINPAVGGFIGGILGMVAVILMILSFRMESLDLYEKFHPIISFFMSVVCTALLIYPLEEKEPHK